MTPSDPPRLDKGEHESAASLAPVVWALAYFPGLAALVVAYFYTVGAVAKTAELRGAGFSTADTLPQTPIGQLLAVGVSTISWRLVVIVLLLTGLVILAILADRRVEAMSAELTDLEKQEHAIRDSRPAVDRQSIMGEPADDAQPVKTDDVGGPTEAADDKSETQRTPAQVIAEVDSIEADLRRMSQEIDTVVATSNKKETEEELADLEHLTEQLAARVASTPHGFWATVRDPARAWRWRRDARRIESHRARLATMRQRADLQEASLEAHRAEISSQLKSLADIRQAAVRSRRERRRAQWIRRALIGGTLVLWLGGILLVPPVTSISNIIVLVYLVFLFRFARHGPRPVTTPFRPTSQVAVVAIALTLGILLQQFVSPGKLPTVVVRTSSGYTSGLLVAQTDAQTTVGFPDCRIEAIPAPEIKYVNIDPRPRQYGRSIGTLLLDWLNGKKTAKPKHRIGKCGG